MSRFSGYFLEDGKKAFIITIVYPPNNYDFVIAAKYRTDDEINRYRENQLFKALRNEYPPFTYGI